QGPQESRLREATDGRGCRARGKFPRRVRRVRARRDRGMGESDSRGESLGEERSPTFLLPPSSFFLTVAMWRWLRIAVLLFILARVAQTAWLARSRTADWKSSLRVVIYPVNADGSQASAVYVGQLGNATFQPVEAFLKSEGARYGLTLRDPVDVKLAPVVQS